MPKGCNFAPRCPYRFEPCGAYDPRIEDAHPPDVACWLYTPAPGQTSAPRQSGPERQAGPMTTGAPT